MRLVDPAETYKYSQAQARLLPTYHPRKGHSRLGQKDQPQDETDSGEWERIHIGVGFRVEQNAYPQQDRQ
jgi:hypothetical protein